MSPAAKASAESAEDKARREAEEQARARWAELVAKASDGDSPGARQVRRAIELERQVASLREKVNDNRTYLRLMGRNDELTDEQFEFVDVFYPEKEKGERRDAAEVEATRRAREFARSNGSN